MTVPTQPTASREAQKRRTFSVAFAGVVVAAVLLVSFLPGTDKRALHTEGRLHSLGHLAVFSLVGYVASRTARSLWTHVAVFLSAMAFGLGVELGEHLVFHNPLEWKDAVVDAFGVACGSLMALATAPRKLDLPPG